MAQTIEERPTTESERQEWVSDRGWAGSRRWLDKMRGDHEHQARLGKDRVWKDGTKEVNNEMLKKVVADARLPSHIITKGECRTIVDERTLGRAKTKRGKKKLSAACHLSGKVKRC